MSQTLVVGGANCAAICYAGEDVFLAISQYKRGVVDIFIFNTLLKIFVHHQVIQSLHVSDVRAFRVGFKSCIGIGGDSSALYCVHNNEFIEEKSPLEYISHIKKIHPLYVNNYRDEVLLLLKTEDTDNKIYLISWIGGGEFKHHELRWNTKGQTHKGQCDIYFTV